MYLFHTALSTQDMYIFMNINGLPFFGVAIVVSQASQIFGDDAP